MPRPSDSTSAEDSRFEFETQAQVFDARASLGDAAEAAIADAVLALWPGADEGTLLEIGAGTGAIGARLAARAPRYVGLDASPAMLARFAARGLPATATLHVGDADARWPLEGGVALVLMARVAHLLDATHVADEIDRVRAARCVVVVARRRRDPSSPWRRASAYARACLERRGYAPKRPDRSGRVLVEALVARGAEARDRAIVHAHVASASFATVLDAWRSKGGLAGIDLPARVKDEVVDEVARHAEATCGPLEALHTFEERFELGVAGFARRQA